VIYCLAAVLAAPHRYAHAAEDTGAALYRRYCASCHGTTGRGDGPVASSLSNPPTDLTRSRDDVATLMQAIDGRRTIRAHGPADMPVWGEVFEQSLIGEPHGARIALLRVQSIAEYVRGLRSGAAAPTPLP
jgi:mono/diheme cytochrome c family protein